VSSFRFTLHGTDGAARRGEFETPHGVVQTPAFMPVGTQGTVKAALHRDVRDAGAEIILGNTTCFCGPATS
jgi:queuine tRNA-ribosyltransferase